MARILFVVLDSTKPSTRLRMLPLAAALRRAGHATTLSKVPTTVTGRLALLAVARRHDCIVLQKKLFPVSYSRLLKMANPRIVFDVDDAVMFHELERSETVRGKFFVRFMAIAAASQQVVAGNRFLAEFASAARPADDKGVAVMPTPVDTSRMPAKSCHTSSHRITIGWIGTKGNLQQLVPLRGILSQLAQEFPQMQLRIVADASIEIPGVPLDFKPWSAEEEITDLHGFDIGIMPLADTLWSRGKGGYKLLQYMAAGLPAVASPVGINNDILRHGENGLLAATAAEWYTCLRDLLADAGLRERLGRAARKTAESDYSLDEYLRRYAALIEDSLQ
ncbi:glycosyltransferase family 4 protein [Sulfuricystis multivorans]|uniref:glycosyltransferase family 4 protein n=1 Tax=Sulfuricystis multivorans TaxID=2211108 RepID=UPI001558C732|nr:glycosyltransferase family 4 protein [Sulfuricystis multivorans]